MCGLIGLICALLLEVFLFLIREQKRDLHDGRKFNKMMEEREGAGGEKGSGREKERERKQEMLQSKFERFMQQQLQQPAQAEPSATDDHGKKE